MYPIPCLLHPCPTRLQAGRPARRRAAPTSAPTPGRPPPAVGLRLGVRTDSTNTSGWSQRMDSLIQTSVASSYFCSCNIQPWCNDKLRTQCLNMSQPLLKCNMHIQHPPAVVSNSPDGQSQWKSGGFAIHMKATKHSFCIKLTSPKVFPKHPTRPGPTLGPVNWVNTKRRKSCRTEVRLWADTRPGVVQEQHPCCPGLCIPNMP